MQISSPKTPFLVNLLILLVNPAISKRQFPLIEFFWLKIFFSPIRTFSSFKKLFSESVVRFWIRRIFTPADAHMLDLHKRTPRNVFFYFVGFVGFVQRFWKHGPIFWVTKFWVISMFSRGVPSLWVPCRVLTQIINPT